MIAIIDYESMSAYVPIRKAASQALQAALVPAGIQHNHAPKDYRIRLVSFTRHPWDRLRSLYEAAMPRAPRFDSFPAFVDWVLAGGGHENIHAAPQSSLLPPEMYYIGKYENLSDDYEVARKLFSRSRPLSPRNESPTRTSWEELFSQLTDRQIEALKRLYAPDFERYDYHA